MQRNTRDISRCNFPDIPAPRANLSKLHTFDSANSSNSNNLREKFCKPVADVGSVDTIKLEGEVDTIKLDGDINLQESPNAHTDAVQQIVGSISDSQVLDNGLLLCRGKLY